MRSRSWRRPVLALLVASVASMHLYASPASGTVEDQRAHLPPPEECTDAVEGVWFSKRFIPALGQWYEFTLEVHRVAPGKTELTGDIKSHFWAGTNASESPPSCAPGGLEAFIDMPGKGTFEQIPSGDQVAFGASSFKVDHMSCGKPTDINYNPDRFSGTIDRALQEFQSVNNDGGSMVNEPQVFRRIRCFDAPTPPPPVIPPPPPPKPPAPATKGCGCNF